MKISTQIRNIFIPPPRWNKTELIRKTKYAKFGTLVVRILLTITSKYTHLT